MSSISKTAAASVPLVIDQTADNEAGLKFFRKMVTEKTEGQKCTSYFDHADYPMWVACANQEDVTQRAMRIWQTIGKDFIFDVAKLIADYGPLLSQRVLAMKLLDDPELKKMPILGHSPSGFSNDWIDLFTNPEKMLSQKRSLQPVFADRLLKESYDLALQLSLRQRAVELRRNKKDGKIDVVPPGQNDIGKPFERLREIAEQNRKQPVNYEWLRSAQMSEAVMWDSTGKELSLTAYENAESEVGEEVMRTIISMDLFSGTLYSVLLREYPNPTTCDFSSIQIVRDGGGCFPVRLPNSEEAFCVQLGFPTPASETAAATQTQPRENSWCSWITWLFRQKLF